MNNKTLPKCAKRTIYGIMFIILPELKSVVILLLLTIIIIIIADVVVIKKDDEFD